MSRAVHLNILLVVLVAIAVNAVQLLRGPLPIPVTDATVYLSIANDLNATGVFTDGLLALQGDGAAHPPGMLFAPLYPAFLAVALDLSAGFRGLVDCVVGAALAHKAAACRHTVSLVTLAQGGLAVVSTVLVYLGASVVSGSRLCAWLAMLLAVGTGEYAYYAGQFLTENLTFPLFTAASILLVWAWRESGAKAWAALGLCFGLLVLVRPSFLYLFYVVLLCQVALFPSRAPRPMLGKTIALVSCLAAFGVVVGPWVLRNWILLDTAAITDGYSSLILVQRVAYNAMSLHEWLVSFVYWLPDFGDKLAASLFEPASYVRLSFDDPQGFYLTGNFALRESTLAAAGGTEEHFGYLIREHILAQPLWHSTVSLALAWRGMWVGQYWGLVAIAVFLPVLFIAARRRWHAFFVYVAPAWFMLGFHAFVSVNVVRYNLILIPGLSLAVAWAATQLLTSGRSRLGPYSRSDPV